MNLYLIQWNDSEDCLPEVFKTKESAECFMQKNCAIDELHVTEVKLNE